MSDLGSKGAQKSLRDPPRGASIESAFAMVVYDQEQNSFFVHPFELQIFGLLERWKGRVQRQVEEGRLVVGNGLTIEVPKPHFHVRPIHHLSIRDQTAIHYLLLQVRPLIQGHLQWSEGRIRLSNAVSEDGYWFKKQFDGWTKFRDLSLKKLQGRYGYALLTDISGYYENVDAKKLALTLQSIGVDKHLCDSLLAALSKWAGNRGRGIPQGYSSSDLLAELYLNEFDLNLRDAGFSHLRYVDDIRVFARTEHEARCALREVTAQLRESGLNIQTAKSMILSSDEAQQELDGIVPIIHSIRDELRRQEFVSDSPYSRSKIASIDKSGVNALSRSILEHAWHKFEHAPPAVFNKTLYRFLLKRLAARGMDGAVAYVLRSLVEHPEETQASLDYLGRIGPTDKAIVRRVARVLTSDKTIFSYQKYQLLSWMYENDISSESVLDFCRSALIRTEENWVVRPHAIAYLGARATYRDLGLLQTVYRESRDKLERATVVCAYRSALSESRSAFYSRATGESEIIDAAIRLSRAA